MSNKKNDSKDDLAKMFLLSYPAYEKIQAKLKEFEVLQQTQKEMGKILKETSHDNDNDKWVRYQNLLVQQKQQQQNATDSPLENENVKIDHALSLTDNDMRKLMKNNGRHVNDPNKWIKYRQLLMKRVQQQRRKDVSMDGNLKTASSMNILHKNLKKILNNRRMNDADKMIKYNTLLAKFGIRKRDIPVAVGDAIDYERGKQSKLRRHRGTQMTPKKPVRNTANVEIQTTEELLPVTNVYTIDPQHDDTLLEPEYEDPAEASQQKLYLSARRKARELLMKKHKHETRNFDGTVDQMSSAEDEEDEDSFSEASDKTIHPAYDKAINKLQKTLGEMGSGTSVKNKSPVLFSSTPISSRQPTTSSSVSGAKKIINNSVSDYFPIMKKDSRQVRVVPSPATQRYVTRLQTKKLAESSTDSPTSSKQGSRNGARTNLWERY